MITTVCVGICKIHEVHNICRGCLRSPLEITAWVKSSDSKKQDILDMLDIKREIFGDSLMEGYSLPSKEPIRE